MKDLNPTDEQIREVTSLIREARTGLCYTDVSQLARDVVTALIRPSPCAAAHPQRPWITCEHDRGHAVPPAHRNERLGLDWHDDGETIHDELGNIELVCAGLDSDSEQVEPGATPAAHVAVFVDLSKILQRAQEVLNLVSVKLGVNDARSCMGAANSCSAARALLRDLTGEVAS